MGALAMGLVHLEEKITGSSEPGIFRQKASFIARLGSGSASRSIYPHFALWGETPEFAGSSDEYAIPVTGYHETFKGLLDTILIVESGAKMISSSLGHSLMDTNPFSSTRFKQARQNLATLKSVLTLGDWTGFIEVMEEEALTLHAMMMTSRPGNLLMRPGTLSIIQKVREFRKDTGCRIGFTLDAGANVHLLFTGEDGTEVNEFITSELVPFCENGRIISDHLGEGPAAI
jgi:diphosphomevalonate decarboxylase